MDIIIALLIVGALMHFIYEGIVAPTLRDNLKHQMFELRDQLRAIQITEKEKCPREAFDIAHQGINQYVNRLHWLTASFMFEFNRAHVDAKVRERVNRRREIVARCGEPEIQRIVKDANHVVGNAFAVNSFPLIVYFIIILALYAAMKYGVTRVGSLLYGKAAEVFASPSKDGNSRPMTNLAL